jgi:hypothetical protein
MRIIKSWKRIITLDEAYERWVLAKKFAYKNATGKIIRFINEEPSEPWWNNITTFDNWLTILRNVDDYSVI